jgi:heptosyltransferase-1
MGEPRFLVIRMGSLGDIVHTLPAVAALRDGIPAAEIDWLVEARWRPLLDGNPTISRVIEIQRRSARSVLSAATELRRAGYSCALDFQSLYKSAILGFVSGANERVGFTWDYMREPLASVFYTKRTRPEGRHKVEHNLSLARSVGAAPEAARFPITISEEAAISIRAKVKQAGLAEYYTMSPGGGWVSKCWPAKRYGQLHQILWKRHGWRGVVCFGPGEEQIAERVRVAAGEPAPALLSLDLKELAALLANAQCLVSADTGPLHLAAALGTPVAGLYGPTDPERNGPYGDRHVVVRNVGSGDTTYRRGREYSSAMLSITAEQAADTVDQLMGID